MKIASRKKKIPSIAKATPKASPKRSMNLGQSRPNSKVRTVPVTAPTANITATAFDQLRASRSAASSFFFRPLHSAISITAGKATPKLARTMWKPRVNPIWLRAASRFEEESARRSTGSGIRSPRAYSSPSASEDRDRVERRPGASGYPKRGRDEQELPAAFPLAGGRQVAEAEIVQQVNTHRIQGEGVHRKVDALRDARCTVAVSVRTQRRHPALGPKLGAVRRQTRLRARGLPRTELLQTSGVSGPDEQDVPFTNRHVLLGLGRHEIPGEDVVMRLQPAHAAG